MTGGELSHDLGLSNIGSDKDKTLDLDLWDGLEEPETLSLPEWN